MKGTIALISAVEKSNLLEDSKYDLLHELHIKRAQLNHALAESLGLSVAASVAPDREPNPRMAQFSGDPETFRAAIPGQTFGVTVHAVNQSAAPASLEKLSVESANGPAWTVTPPAVPQPDSKPVDVKFTVKVPDSGAFTRPYFTRPNIEQSYYDIADPQYLNQPLAPYPLAAWADWSMGA